MTYPRHHSQTLCDVGPLKYMTLSNLSLTGTIPECIGSLNNLVVLKLAHNSLSGTISSKLCEVGQSLIHFELYRNNLGGTLPGCVGNTTPHHIPRQTTTRHDTTCHHTTLHHTAPHRTTSHHTTPRHTTPLRKVI